MISPNNWMHTARMADSRFGEMSLWDMTLPGSHDTLSYDLSDQLTELPSTPNMIGSIVRDFAITQSINITQQLDAGIRFLDIRVMRSTDGVWYGTHTVRTNKPAIAYINEISQWLEKSKGEYLIVFISRHGAECLKGEEQFPHVSIAEKQQFWTEIEIATRGYLLSPTYITSSLNNLQLISSSGMFILASDHEEMTGNSSMALDACMWLNNTGGGGRPSHKQYIDDVAYMKDLMSNSLQNKYYLRSMANAASKEEVIARISSESFIPSKWRKIAYSDCIYSYKLPFTSNFCSSDLPELASFCNFYNRRIFIDYLNTGARPNAFYVDLLTTNGALQISGTDDFDFYGLVVVMNINVVCANGCSDKLLNFAINRKSSWTVSWPNSSKLGLTSISPKFWT